MDSICITSIARSAWSNLPLRRLSTGDLQRLCGRDPGALVRCNHTLRQVRGRHGGSLMSFDGSLRDRIQWKHYSIRTEQAYVDWIRRFVLHHNKRRPRDMGAAEVEAFLTHLAVAPSRTRSVDSRSGAGAPCAREGLAARDAAGRAAGGRCQTGHVVYAATFVRHPPPAIGLRHPYRAGVAHP